MPFEVRSKTGDSVVGVIIEDPQEALRRALDMSENDSTAEITIVDLLGAHHGLDSFAAATGSSTGQSPG